MTLWKPIKKVFLGCSSAILSITAYLANFLQMVRIAIAKILSLPRAALIFTAVFMASCCAIAFLFLENSWGTKLLSAAGICLTVLLAYKIVAFLLDIILQLISSLLAVLAFEVVVDFCRRLLEKTIAAYIILEDPDCIRKHDRFILFGIPSLLHNLQRVCNKLCNVLCIVLYPLCGSIMLYLAYGWAYSGDYSDYGTTDHIISWAMIILIASFGVYAGHCFGLAVKIALAGTSELDELFSVYSNLFRYWENRQQEPKSDDESSSSDCYDTSNPYFKVLEVATNEDDLRKLYHQEARKIHPDVSNKDDANHQSALLNDAYTYFRNKFKKK